MARGFKIVYGTLKFIKNFKGTQPLSLRESYKAITIGIFVTISIIFISITYEVTAIFILFCIHLIKNFSNEQGIYLIKTFFWKEINSIKN